jgi:DNA-binding FrmR family transcriptional regulator
VIGYTADKASLNARLKRIEGQVRGLERMVDEDRYCIDVLTQVNAARAALKKVGLILLKDHVDHCVAGAIRSGDPADKVRELSEAVERFVAG